MHDFREHVDEVISYVFNLLNYINNKNSNFLSIATGNVFILRVVVDKRL